MDKQLLLRIIDRKDRLLPRFNASNIDAVDPKRTEPHTERELPILPTARRLIVLPHNRASKTDKVLPNLTYEVTLIVLPILATLLTETVEPIFNQSNTDTPDPKRPKLRIDREDPRLSESKIDIELPNVD
jgi:hypothetical protein